MILRLFNLVISCNFAVAFIFEEKAVKQVKWTSDTQFGNALSWNGNQLLIGSPKGPLVTCTNDDCSMIQLNFVGEGETSADGRGLPDRQGRNGVLFGYSMSSAQEGEATVCAPRYFKKNTPKYLSGSCFAVDLLTKIGRKIITDFGSNIQEGSTMPMEGFSTSSLLTDDRRETYHVAGAPGYSKSTGTVSFSKKSEFHTIDHGRYLSLADTLPKELASGQMLGYSVALSEKLLSSKDVYAAFGGPGITILNETFSKGVVMFLNLQTKLLQTEWALPGDSIGSYFGISIQLIDINGDLLDDLIVGSPYESHNCKDKEESTGAVHIFYNQARANPYKPFSKMPGWYKLLKCPQGLAKHADSRFGQTIAKLGDINKDGYEDFAIGAPNHDNTGAVLIYLGDKDNKIDEPSEIVSPPESSDTMPKNFGSAISEKTGDFNQDGLQDIAIGDPLNSMTYVIHGRAPAKFDVRVLDSTMKEENSNTCIQTSSPNVQKFRKCFSFEIAAFAIRNDIFDCQSANFDLNVLLKVAPSKAWLSEKQNQTNWIVDSQLFDEIDPVFVELINAYKGNPFVMNGEKRFSDVKDQLPKFFNRITEAITADTIPGDYLTLRLRPNCVSSMTSNMPSYSVQNKERVYLILRDDGLYDRNLPIILGAKWALDYTNPQSIDALRNTPAFEKKLNTKLLKIEPLQHETGRQQGEVRISARSGNNYGDNHVIYAAFGENQIIEIDSSVQNTGSNNLNGVSILVHYPKEVFQVVDPDQLVEEGMAYCGFPSNIQWGQRPDCKIRFSVTPDPLAIKKPMVFMNVSVLAASKNVHLTGIIEKVIEFKIKIKADIVMTTTFTPKAFLSYTGMVNGALGNRFASAENSIGYERLVANIDIRNRLQKSYVGSSKMVIHWPYEIADNPEWPHGRYLFYMIDTPRVFNDKPPANRTSSITCDQNTLDEINNIYNKRKLQRSMSEAKNDHYVGKEEIVNLPSFDYPPLDSELRYSGEKVNKKYQSTLLGCFNGQLRCKPLVCQLDYMPNGDNNLTIEIPFRVWEATLNKQFTGVSQVLVEFQVTWMTDNSLPIEYPDGKDLESIENKIILELNNKVDILENTKDNKIKFVLAVTLSVIVSFALLGIIFIICLKCGFFRRRKKARNE